MRDKALDSMRNTSSTCNFAGSHSRLFQMGPIKSFNDLQESLLKLRENFQTIVDRNQFMSTSPLKKKDLNSEFGVMGDVTRGDQECETDEEENEIKPKAATTATTTTPSSYI